MAHQPRYPHFVELVEPSVITEIALHLVAFRDDEFDLAGTATVVCPNVAVTAKHVLEHFMRRFEGKDLPDGGNVAATFHLQAIQMLRDGITGAWYSVTKIVSVPWSDVALLLLEPGNQAAGDHKWLNPILNLFPPEVGSFVAGFGYRLLELNKDEATRSITISRSESTTVGEVVEIHHEMRDSSRLSFPCFRTNARFEGGMSGGPVFNDNGELCGIICSSMPPYSDDEHYVSYAVTLWPLMGLKIAFPRPDIPAGTSYFVYDLVGAGYIKAIGVDRISVSASPEHGLDAVAVHVKDFPI